MSACRSSKTSSRLSVNLIGSVPSLTPVLVGWCACTPWMVCLHALDGVLARLALASPSQISPKLSFGGPARRFLGSSATSWT